MQSTHNIIHVLIMNKFRNINYTLETLIRMQHTNMNLCAKLMSTVVFIGCVPGYNITQYVYLK